MVHILVCFLAYVSWKTLAQMCRSVGLGDEPCRIFDEISELRRMDVIFPTSEEIENRRRCVSPQRAPEDLTGPTRLGAPAPHRDLDL